MLMLHEKPPLQKFFAHKTFPIVADTAPESCPVFGAPFPRLKMARPGLNKIPPERSRAFFAEKSPRFLKGRFSLARF